MSLTPHQQALIFTDFLSQPGNTVCADCSEPHPSWASVNNSVLVCFQCAGIHRSLGTEISQVKSVKLDAWMPREVTTLSQGVSTQFVNENLLESSVPSGFLKPNSRSSREERERYIRAKYVDRAFLPGKGKPRQPPVYAAIPEGDSSSSTGSSAPTMQTAGSIEFVGILKVTMISGKSLSGPKAPPDLQLQSAPHICVGLGTQVFKTKPAKGRDKNNPVFQEDLMFSWDGRDSLNMEIMDSNSFIRDDTLGCCSIDVADLQLPSGVPLFLDVPLEQAAAEGSLQMQLLLERLDH